MQEHIKKMAVEAGFRIEDGGWLLCGPASKPEPEIDALERLVQAAARECVDMLQSEAKDWAAHAVTTAIDASDGAMSYAREDSLNEMAKAIRARFGLGE